jgi:hypothetical protein
MKPMQKQHLVFFPARFQQPLPGEMYGNFISKLSENYEVHIASSDPTKNDVLLNNILARSDCDSVGFISHSSGVADLWNTYSSGLSSVDIDKIVLIEPLDLQKGFSSVSSPTNGLFEKFNANMELLNLDNINDKIEEIVETDYVELLKSNIFGGFRKNKKTNTKTNVDSKKVGEDEFDVECDCEPELGKMMVVKHKQSDKWKFIPTIPPLSVLNSDLINFQETMVIDEIVIDKFSHFDILDRPWANIMNRASLGTNKEQQDLDEYLNMIDDIVFQVMS